MVSKVPNKYIFDIIYGRLSKLVSLLKLQTIVNLLQLIAIPIALYSIVQANNSIELSQKANALQEITLAWQQISVESSGNVGKAGAINFLASRGEPIVGLRINCDSSKGKYENDTWLKDHSVCVGRPYLKGMNLFGEMYRSHNVNLKFSTNDFSGSEMVDTNLSNMVVSDTNFSRTMIYRFNLNNVNIYNFDFSNAIIKEMNISHRNAEGIDFTKSKLYDVKFERNQFFGVNFTDAKLSNFSIDNVQFNGVNVSGTDFCHVDEMRSFGRSRELDYEFCTFGLNEEHVKGMWAWSDNPPKAIGTTKEILKGLKYCDPAIRDDYIKEEATETLGFITNKSYMRPKKCTN